MKRIRRFLAILVTLALLVPVASMSESGVQEIPEEEGVRQEESIPEDWEAAEIDEEYWTLSMWMKESEGTVKLFDAEDNPLELDDEMRFSGGTILETEEESLAVVDMDRKRLAIMDETSRAGFEDAENGNRISITLQNGTMYFRVGHPLEENESFDVVMDDIRLAIRGTCGMVQQSEGGMSIILASGHAVITHVPEGGGEPGEEPDEETDGNPGEETEEIMIEAGEIVSVSKDETDGGIRFEKRKLAEDEVPAFLTDALRRDPAQLEKVYAETGWQPEKLFGDDIPVWMLPAEELDGIPEELVGRTLGCGGWYRISTYISFPEKNKMTVAFVDPRSGETAEYTIASVKQYTPHFYELRCESGSRVREKKLILPGITEEEIAQLKACLKLEFMKEQWEMIRSKNQYVLYDDTVTGLFFDDITAAGVSRAKPFADYQPCGYAVMFGEQRNAGLPDSLIGKTLAIKRGIGETEHEETYTFISKNTVKLYRPFNIYSWEDSNIWHVDDWREVTLTVSVDYISDHFLRISGNYLIHNAAFSGEDEQHSFSLVLMIPGMSERETAFCRECIASRRGGIIQPSSVPIDGNSYCTYEFPDEILRIIPLEVR